ncbi:hypothetical protein [Micromonospora sp. NPDC049891]|uniref:hypothetical protein n=1 Tax=Micromonospora sp. NPDC049891 TaxID=3155655 RepID=UPI00340D817B
MTMPDPMLAPLALAVALLVFVFADMPVARHRVTRLAARHGLTVTVDSGPQLIAYLVVTRRWRAAGAAFGCTLYALQGLAEQRLAFSIVYAVAGWFAGALLAEVRLAHRTSPRPAALLVRRTSERYLPPPLRAALPLSVATCLALAAITVTTPAGSQAGARVALWTGTAVLVSVLAWVARRRVLLRPQPPGPPEVLATDDAIRSRSLHALTASATTLMLYCVLDELARLSAGQASEALAVPLVVAGLVVVPLAGWRMATSPWRVPTAAAQ